MSDALNCPELDGQQVELLPARTVLSMFAQVADGGQGTDGTPGTGTFGMRVLGIDIPPGSNAGNGIGGSGGDAHGGNA